MPQIETAESFYVPMAYLRVPPPEHPDHHAMLNRVRETPPYLLPALMFAGGSKPTGTNANLTVKAEVEHGRWIVHCPFCPSAQMAAYHERFFYCSECLMRDGAGKQVEVEWPDEADEITAHLQLRPMAMSANWFPGESVAGLHDENKALGLVPDWSAQ